MGMPMSLVCCNPHEMSVRTPLFLAKPADFGRTVILESGLTTYPPRYVRDAAQTNLRKPITRSRFPDWLSLRGVLARTRTWLQGFAVCRKRFTSLDDPSRSQVTMSVQEASPLRVPSLESRVV